MNPGALLVGLAAAIVLAAYVALPFRKRADADRQIEAWVAALRSRQAEPGAHAKPDAAPDIREAAPDLAFCHQCGRQVRPHHRFCPHCGANLREEEL